MAKHKIIPKRVGRFKVPKAVRRMGDQALSDPRVAEAAVGLLAALAAVAAERGGAGAARVRDLFGRAREGAPEEGGEEGGVAAQASGIAAAVVDEVLAAFRAPRKAKRERDAADAPAEPAPEVGREGAEGEEERVH